MANNFTLWCVNNSNSGANVCVYQDIANAGASGGTPETLAWLVGGCNPGSSVQFVWQTSYDFVWFDSATPRSQAIAATTLGSQVVLSKNQYGYKFSAPAAGQSGQLLVSMDASIPSQNQTVAGIGMGGGGTFAYPAQPTTNALFAPVADANLVYWITFNYSGQQNEVLALSSVNTPAKVVFPYGVGTMTATYDVSGSWTVTSGAPPQAAARRSGPAPAAVVYRPGLT